LIITQCYFVGIETVEITLAQQNGRRKKLHYHRYINQWCVISTSVWDSSWFLSCS